MEKRTPSTDRLLIIEVVLALAGIGLGLYFYLIPAESPDYAAPWWSGLLLAILFFAVVILETVRRRAQARRLLRSAIDQDPGDTTDKNQQLPT